MSKKESYLWLFFVAIMVAVSRKVIKASEKTVIALAAKYPNLGVKIKFRVRLKIAPAK